MYQYVANDIDEERAINRFLITLTYIIHYRIHFSPVPHVLLNMRKSIHRFLINVYYFIISFQELTQTNVNLFYYHFNDENVGHDINLKSLLENNAYDFFKKAFHHTDYRCANYMKRVFDTHLIDVNVPYVNPLDFNVAMMYFILNGKIRLSSFATLGFIQKKFNPFDIVYDNILLKIIMHATNNGCKAIKKLRRVTTATTSLFDLNETTDINLIKICYKDKTQELILLKIILYHVHLLPINMWCLETVKRDILNTSNCLSCYDVDVDVSGGFTIDFDSIAYKEVDLLNDFIFSNPRNTMNGNFITRDRTETLIFYDCFLYVVRFVKREGDELCLNFSRYDNFDVYLKKSNGKGKSAYYKLH